MAYTPVTILDGNNATKTMGAFQDPASVNYPSMTLDNQRATYRVAASFTPFGTSDITLINIKGSATKTVRIIRIMVGGVATALKDTLFLLTRTSSVGTGGTAVTPTPSLLDTGDSAATAVVTHYTNAAQSSGTTTGLGTLSYSRVFQDTVTTPTVASREATVLFPERGVNIGHAIVLRGATQYLEVQNANAGSLGSGSVLDYVVEWIEDAS